MFNDDRSDFAVPIAGFFIFGAVSLLLALLMLNERFEFSEFDNMTGMAGSVLVILGILGIVDGAVALKKAYLVEGFSFIAFSLFAVCCNSLVGSTGSNLMLGIVVLVTFLFIALMSYKGEVLDLAVMDVLLGIALFLMLGFEDMQLYASILLILVVAVCGYVLYTDWSYVQEVMEDYEQAMYESFGDDDCGCGCGCEDDDCDCEEDHGCGCGCEDHKH